jgi:D-sedoheptulose 7-phosphate isomerase
MTGTVCDPYGRFPELEVCRSAIEAAADALIRCFGAGGKLLACGNGGSAADCDHIAGELMKSFLLRRPADARFRAALAGSGLPDAAEMADLLEGALPAISLPSQTSVLTAFSNDVSAELAFAQMVYGYGRPGDVLLCLSTSGGLRNIVAAAVAARAAGLVTVALTGARESELSRICDIAVRVPESGTYRVQELYLPVYHYLCARAEYRFFGGAEGGARRERT